MKNSKKSRKLFQASFRISYIGVLNMFEIIMDDKILNILELQRRRSRLMAAIGQLGRNRIR